jgi:2-desacetyl-2-hydroxyethyl bacteriochlorophyllide A dehydrogenase
MEVKMKALFLEGPGEINIKEIPYPEQREGYAIVKMTAASICGSDISAYRGHGQAIPYPLILGHEAVGIVEQIDNNEYGIQKGDFVILDPYLYCNTCYPCSLGRTNCCEHLKVLGVQTDGAMREYISHPNHLLRKIPDNIPPELAPLAEPLTIALHGLHRAKLKKNEHVAIIGAGPIGLLAGMAALQYDAIPVLIDMVEERLELGKSLGIKHTINVKTQDAVERLKEITNGRMAEVVLEMSGSHVGIQTSLLYASYCGRISFTGWPTGETSLNTPLITRKELDIRGARTSVNEFEEALNMISTGQINARAILRETVSFDELPTAFKNQSDYPGKYLKITALF